MCTETIRSAAGRLFSDALPAWRSVAGVCGRLARWRASAPQLYADAYVPDCLPRLLAPYVRHQVRHATRDTRHVPLDTCLSTHGT